MDLVVALNEGKFHICNFFFLVIVQPQYNNKNEKNDLKKKK